MKAQFKRNVSVPFALISAFEKRRAQQRKATLGMGAKHADMRPGTGNGAEGVAACADNATKVLCVGTHCVCVCVCVRVYAVCYY